MAVPVVLVLPLLENVGLFFVLVFFVEFILFLTASPINIGYLDLVAPEMRGMALGFGLVCLHLLGDCPSQYLYGVIRAVFMTLAREGVGGMYQHTLNGSFSAVSKPICVSISNTHASRFVEI